MLFSVSLLFLLLLLPSASALIHFVCWLVMCAARSSDLNNCPHCSVRRFAQAKRDGSEYFVLLIITDGIITDMPQTTEAIVRVRPLDIICTLLVFPLFSHSWQQVIHLFLVCQMLLSIKCVSLQQLCLLQRQWFALDCLLTLHQCKWLLMVTKGGVFLNSDSDLCLSFVCFCLFYFVVVVSVLLYSLI